MKHNLELYIGYISDAAARNLAFVNDHYKVVLWSALCGLGVWLLEFANIYLFNDYKFLVWLGLCMLYNAFSGVKLAGYLNRLDPTKYPRPSAKVFREMTFSKLVYYMLILNSTHALSYFQIRGDQVTIFQAFQYAVCTIMMATEVYSVHENYKEMGKKTFFSAIAVLLKNYLPAKSTPE